MTASAPPAEFSDALCREAERLLRVIALRDLAGAPAYIVPQSRLSPELGGDIEGTYGWTSPSADRQFRDAIGDRFRGRGPCAVINDRRFLAFTDPADARAEFLAIAVHEAAHWFVRETLFAARDDVTDADLRDEARQMVASFDATYKSADAFPLLVWQHSLDFFRVALHLLFRAEALGVAVVHPSLLAVGFPVSSPWRYIRAIGDEPRRMVGATFAQIKATPVPDALAELWADDVELLPGIGPERLPA